MTTTSFVGGFSGEGSVGVASLDPPLIQQTKTEIRSLASEIARLAHSTIEPKDFYSGFLPRLVTAMGAEAAAVWQTTESLRQHGKIPRGEENLDDDSSSSLRLVAQHLLPSVLLQDNSELHGSNEGQALGREQLRAPSQQHSRILDCVLAEGAPILVPPQTVSVETDRPVNPLEHSILIVPVRIENDVEFLLEVVQRASGGPAAQRGYLRFVAQMADLMADYLRRQLLREHALLTNRLQRYEYWLTSVSQASHLATQKRCVVDGLADLLDSFQVFLLRSGRSPKVIAASGLELFDPRSETILLACAVERELANIASSVGASNTAGGSVVDLIAYSHSNPQSRVPALKAALVSDRIVRLQIDDDGGLVAMLAFADPCVVPDPEEMLRVAKSLVSLLDDRATDPDWVRKWWPFRFRAFGSKSQLKRGRLQTWTMRVALVGLLAVIALFPVPQQISATAVLNAKSKSQYFAPFDANIAEVHVDDEQAVEKGEPLLTLASPTLEKELQAIVSEADVLQERLRGLKLTISGSIPGERANSLTAQRTELEAQLESNGKQQQVLLAELAKRKVFAQASGRITTWDVRNRLTNLPVKYGQLLLSTIDPDGEWELQVSLPEHRVGLVSDALALNPGEGVPLRFTLASHPGVMLEGQVADLSDQAARNARGETVLLARAAISGNELPLKKEGAIARVTIDCGRVPAIWLVVRDAYWACMSRLKMIW